jgi:hypothetical protein
VVLLDAGQEPRVLLRYRLASGRKEKVALTLRIRTRVRGPGLPRGPIRLPAIRLAMNVEITDKLSEEQARYSFQFSDADLLETEEVDPVLLSATRADLQKTVGVRGHAVIDARGFDHDVDLDLPKSLTPQMRQILRDTKNSLNQMSPLPEDPVGIGARWEVTQMAPSNGLVVEQKVIYELASLQGDRGQLNATLAYRADPQPAYLPGLPRGISAELVKLQSKGVGEVTFDAGRLLPASARISMQNESEFRLHVKESEQQMVMEAETALEIEQL